MRGEWVDIVNIKALHNHRREIFGIDPLLGSVALVVAGNVHILTEGPRCHGETVAGVRGEYQLRLRRR